jgi:heme-degrading monooxygenase HmoA
MFARVTTLQGAPDRVEDGIRAVREQVIPAAKEMRGFKGILALADRSTGKMLGITLWDSEDSMRESEEAANLLRSDSAADETT